MLKQLTHRLNALIGPAALLGFFLLLLEHTGLMQTVPWLVPMAHLAVLSLFAADVLLNWITGRTGWRFFLTNGWELIVFAPLIFAAIQPEETTLSMLLRQAAVVVILLTRTHSLRRCIAWLALKPAQLLLMSFAGIIGVGTLLLLLPAATATGAHTDLSGALFTATSATCVTGLTVYDTATHFTRFGQIIILLLIQVGGLGIMTFSMSLALLMRRSVSMRNQSIMQDVLDQDTLTSMRRLTGFIVLMTLFLEAAGALALFFSWRTHFDTLTETAWVSLFHSISAFCNAGFSTFSANLMPFQSHLAVNAIIGALIVLGGIGFVVIGDFHEALMKKLRRRRGPKHKFRIQSRLALTWTGGLIVAGTALIYVLERGRLLNGLPTGEALLIALFQSVSTRTAGFNTCDIGALHPSTLLICIILMFIGACPGGTAGGIKVTTPAVLWSVISAGFRRREEAELYRRTVPVEVIQKAVMVLCSSLLLVCGGAVLLSISEQKDFLEVLFETVSAFGTVGLSTGLTPELSLPGRALITLLMFIGRLGPLTIGFAFMLRDVRPAKYSYAEERIMIG